MPRVALTDEQRRRQRCERRSEALAGGLASYKNKTKKKNEELAAELGVGVNTIPRILNGQDVRISIMAYWRLLEVSGLEVRQRELPLS